MKRVSVVRAVVVLLAVCIGAGGILIMATKHACLSQGHIEYFEIEAPA